MARLRRARAALNRLYKQQRTATRRRRAANSTATRARAAASERRLRRLIRQALREIKLAEAEVRRSA